MLHGQSDGRYLDINHAAEELAGYPRAEMIGKSAVEVGILHPDSLEAAQRMRAQAEAGRPSMPTEIVIFHRSGREINWPSTRAMPCRKAES